MPVVFTSKLGPFLFVLTLGLVVRLYLINNQTLVQWLQNRVELITPLNSWQRVQEGLYLRNKLNLTTAYSGDLVHELPVMLVAYSHLIQLVNVEYVPFTFVLIDGLNAILLFSVANLLIDYLIRLEFTDTKVGKYNRYFKSVKPAAENDQQQKQLPAESLLLTPARFNSYNWSLICMAVYLLNPFQIASCITLSTITVHHFILLLWLFFLLNDNAMLAFAFLALHSNITVYSSTLVVASICYLTQSKYYINGKYTNAVGPFFSIVKWACLYLIFTVAIVALNLHLEKDNIQRLVESTYLFVLKVPDLLPNMGLFWYFFTEIFDHFQVFFTYVFQLNVFLYAVPLTMRLKDNPVVNLVVQVALLAVLKSYPSVAEVGFYMSLLPPFLNYLFGYMRNFLVYSIMLLVALVLAPVMFYLWLGSGGGNANFYFAITLVYSVGQIFLILDLLYACLKRDYIKLYGAERPKCKDGSLAKLALE